MITFKYFLTSIVCILTFSIQSCKEKEDKIVPNDSAEQSTYANDDFSLQQESEQVVNEATNIFSRAGNVREAESLNLCGLLNIDTIAPNSYLLKFNGRSCDGKSRREGNILVTLTGSTWPTAGSNILIDFQGYKLTRADGKYFTLVGQINTTNLNGGLVSSLRIGSPAVVHSIYSNNLNLTFDDGSVKTWNTSRKKTIIRTASGLEVKLEGNGKIDGFTNAGFWGKNRKGNDFLAFL